MISIIIPALNEESNIIRLLKSIKSNTLLSRKYYELIVVDGNSKDNTVRNARKYADKVIIEKKRGIALARNKGAKASKGEVLLFIDADVIINSDVISFVNNHVKSSKDLLCGVVRLRPDISNKWPGLVFWFLNNLMRFFAKTRKPFAFGTFMFFDRKLFNKIHGFREGIDGFEDHDIVRRALKFGKFNFINDHEIIFDARRLVKLGVNKWIITSLNNVARKGSKGFYPTVHEI